ncbi:3'-5' exonuclease [Candidatus Woesearchaeota archaeon]|nr:3'-5' exonuclease [Candidatus Woesearchaeota archaeon]
MLKEYTVLDIETTGLSRYTHKITEIAAVHVVDGIVKKEFITLVNPETKIPRFITKLTGINDELVKDAPTIKEVMPKFLNFIKDSIMVAHNASFDYSFLKHNVELHTKNFFENERLCTRKLATRIIPDLPSKKLSCICDYYNIKNEQEHRALADVNATLQIFQKFHDVLSASGLNQKQDILKFESMPTHKCKQILFKDVC